MNKATKDILQNAIGYLRVPGIDDPAGDTKKLLAHALGVSKHDLILLQSKPISDAVVSKFDNFIKLRKRLKPVSQIIGVRSFWGHDFIISEKVLDPRPETEEIIFHALNEQFDEVLDLGTGSGAIIISLLLENRSVRGMATDISIDALKVAKKNVQKFKIGNRIELIQSNWCEKINRTFDLVVANPPYIDADKFDDYHESLGNWEPKIALFSDKAGLAAYSRIARQLKTVLKKTGVALFEIGYNQSSAVSNIFRHEGYRTEIFKDMADKHRVIKVTF